MTRLQSQRDDSSWQLLEETKLVDNLPTLLRGVAKAIENPGRIEDFEHDGIIHRAALELGRNRRMYNFSPAEVLFEQETLREVIWEFCSSAFSSLDLYDLEWRINRPLDKMASTITESYIDTYVSELKYLSQKDKQTNLLNYEAFKNALADELRRSRRYRHPFSLIMMDIDNFVDYRESFGHNAANSLIQEIARMISQVIRSVDVPARYGMDEFAVILPETSKKQARKVAERLRRAVKLDTRHSAEVRGELKSPVTISIGVSSYPKDAETVDEMISLADESLFEAKKAGRDMVVWK